MDIFFFVKRLDTDKNEIYIIMDKKNIYCFSFLEFFYEGLLFKIFFIWKYIIILFLIYTY